MKNTINYYYNFNITELIKKDEEYYFYINNEEYHLIIYKRPYEDIKGLFELNNALKQRGCISHELILNKDNQLVTVINDIPYILIKLMKYKNDKVFINDLNYIQNMTFNINYDKSLLRSDWVKLWCDKIDYYEYQISQIGKKYPILCDSLSYYIGLGENAISYIVNNQNKIKNIKYVVSHKRIDIKKGSYGFYNPINYIIDNRVRDLSEYIKNSFFYSDINMYEIKSFLDYSNYNESEYITLYARLLFPSYYFDIYDEIINNNLNEDKIIRIIEKNTEYERLLFDIYNYIVYEKHIHIDQIEWIIKRHS